MKKLTSIILGIIISLSVFAKEAKFGSKNVALKASTMGVGIEYTHPLKDYFSVSIGLNKLDVSKNVKLKDVNYTAKVDLRSISLIANYNPLPNTYFWRGFRVRAGFYNNNNKLSLTVKPNNNKITINGFDFKTTEANISTSAKVSFDRFSPYLGIGYGSSPSQDSGLFGWNFNFDIGVMKSKAMTKLTGTCNEIGALGAGACSTFKTNIAAQNTKLNKALKDLDLIPVIGIGLSYSF